MTKTEKRFLILILLVLMVVLVNMAWDANGSERRNTPDVGLWLARSCVGEAVFDAVRTGECTAILGVYVKRSLITGMNLYQVVRKYSATVKPRSNHPRRWVLNLSRGGEKPKHWANNSKWPAVRHMWGRVLAHCDDFLAGKIPDTLPEADHYGGRMDRKRAMKNGWFRLKTNYKNEFWSVTDPSKKKFSGGEK